MYRYLSHDGLAGEEGTFLLCTFWLAQAQALAGDVEAATATFEHAVAAINDLGLIAEEVDPGSGEMIGNFPQAFSHIGLINAAWAITQAQQSTGRTPERADLAGLAGLCRYRPPDQQVSRGGSVIVLCPDPTEAAKCRQLIRTGHPGFDLAPVVIDSSGPPGLTDGVGPLPNGIRCEYGRHQPGIRAAGARHLLEAMMTTSEYEKTLAEDESTTRASLKARLGRGQGCLAAPGGTRSRAVGGAAGPSGVLYRLRSA